MSSNWEDQYLMTWKDQNPKGYKAWHLLMAEPLPSRWRHTRLAKPSEQFGPYKAIVVFWRPSQSQVVDTNPVDRTRRVRVRVDFSNRAIRCGLTVEVPFRFVGHERKSALKKPSYRNTEFHCTTTTSSSTTSYYHHTNKKFKPSGAADTFDEAGHLYPVLLASGR